MAELGDNAEIVLMKRPVSICIEVPTANDKLADSNGKKRVLFQTWCEDMDLGP